MKKKVNQWIAKVISDLRSIKRIWMCGMWMVWMWNASIPFDKHEWKWGLFWIQIGNASETETFLHRFNTWSNKQRTVYKVCWPYSVPNNCIVSQLEKSIWNITRYIYICIAYYNVKWFCCSRTNTFACFTHNAFITLSWIYWFFF